MLTKRIIPCLDVKNGKVVKGINFKGLRDVGYPPEMAAAYGYVPDNGPAEQKNEGTEPAEPKPRRQSDKKEETGPRQASLFDF